MLETEHRDKENPLFHTQGQVQQRCHHCCSWEDRGTVLSRSHTEKKVDLEQQSSPACRRSSTASAYTSDFVRQDGKWMESCIGMRSPTL